jgi:hypothetical protein
VGLPSVTLEGTKLRRFEAMIEIHINQMLFVVFDCSINCFLHNRIEEINYVLVQCKRREAEIQTPYRRVM